jgi:hypothetical protein
MLPVLGYSSFDSSWKVVLMRQGSVYRLVAILFLLLASADIAVDVVSPELCCEELRSLAGSYSTDAASTDAAAPSQESGNLYKISAGDNSTPEAPSSPITEEECFCCCAHILPSLHFEVANFDLDSLTSGLANTILPTAPPQSAYHPPRLS